MNPIYSSEISKEEKKYGFKKIQIESDYDNIFGEKDTEYVAVVKLSESDYLFKLSDNQGYKHKRWGRRESFPDKEPCWHPMGEEIYPHFDIKEGEKILFTCKFENIIGEEYTEKI
ncbi:hypothetical protein [Puniceicoccus vermicola]|uniref:Uncharacterized protein n=1 Tax=Puniceicoccus vermicola TaxID=388746 RepID=A0A7X1AY11_9BACT|nr:hypothetical protein [Puniceicoccus vermicola]MBC2602071.1 hypothetical protein [Puniceicoccus vermicola]